MHSLKTKQIYSFILLLFLISSFSYSQNHTLDSIRNEFYAYTEDSLKWDRAAELAHYFLRSNLDSTMKWTQKSFDIAEEGNNTLLLGRSYVGMGLAYYTLGAYQDALENFTQAIDIFRGLKEEELLHYAEFEMAQVYREQGNYAEARKYIDHYYEFYKSQDNGRKMLIALSSYSTLFEKLEEADSMLFYSEKALKVAIDYEETYFINILYTNLASAYYASKNYPKARSYSLKVRKLAQEQEDFASVYYADFVLGQLYADKGKRDSSQYHLAEALSFARNYGEVKMEAEITELLSQQYEAMGNFKEALKFSQEAKALGDSLAKSTYDKQAAELNVKYETQQKETQIALQSAELSEAENRRNLILFSALGVFLIILLLFILFRNRQLTHRKLVEQALQYQEEEAKRLKELDQLKSSFFANVSHEFRTPLSLILGPLKEMQNGSFQGDEAHYRELMIRNGERLLSLVNQLLELSKLEAGQMELQLKAGELNTFVRTMVLAFESFAIRKNIDFQTQFSDEPILVYFDSDKLEKIISNLLANAFKFCPEGGVIRYSHQLISSEEEEKVGIQFEVFDSGKGISEEEKAFIFQRFYSQSDTRYNRDGMGIGLALVKELIDLFEGKIEIDSEEGAGSCFRLRLFFDKASKAEAIPVQKNQLHIEAEKIDEWKKSFLLMDKSKPLVLLVEDNADMRNYLKEQLEPFFSILLAKDGVEGLEMAQEHIPDLIVSDWMMPHMPGTRLLEEIRKDLRSSHIPLIMLTAKSDQQDLMEGIEKGADAYLSKPFEISELKLRITKLIERQKILQKAYSKIADKSSVKIHPQEISSREELFLQKLIEIIEAHLDDEDFSIPQLGKEVGMSRSQLHRKVKALTDKSPSAFVRSIRMKHAHQLLEQKGGNISEVAFQVGIPNLSYFSRSFRDEFGYPPSDLL